MSWKNVSKPNMPWVLCPCFASGTRVQTYVRRGDKRWRDTNEIRPGLDGDGVGLCLEEIEQRLESARLMGGEAGTWETCLWACECFTIYERAMIGGP